MATIPIIGNVTVGGARKEISGGYVNIGGVWKPIVKTYVNVNGVWKNAWKELYTWKKYTVKKTTSYTKETSSTTKSSQDQTAVYYGTSYTFNSSTGAYTIANPKTGIFNTLDTTNKYCVTKSGGTDSTMYEYKSRSGSGYNKTITLTKYTSKSTTTESRGTYVSDVTSENSSAYPTNGKHSDGYWYVKQ